MFFNYLLCILSFTLLKIVMSFPLKEFQVDNKAYSDFTSVKEANETIMSMDELNSGTNSNITLIRAKRQSGGAGRFTDAAKMPQVKIMRLFTQMFKNLWAASYVGGTHPLHPNIPKVVIALYKQKIMEFFFPEIGQDPEKVT